MKDFEHIELLWKTQPEKRMPSSDDVLRQVKKMVGGLSRKLFLGIVAMAVTVALMFVILFFVPFRSYTTYLGIGIIMLTVCVYAAMMIRDYRLIARNDFTVDPVNHLQQIKQYQRNRARFSGWVFYIYMLLITAGFALYFIEIFEHVSIWFQLSAYLFTAIWFLFCTFYLKDRINKNENEKVALVIDRLERLQKQFG
ncbi:MAG: hypothetical protein INR69_20755 [Mucilaginibacter polytrichastri]|nr:hypothetical protein [Mucilaginibacter polytrichastri]